MFFAFIFSIKIGHYSSETQFNFICASGYFVFINYQISVPFENLGTWCSANTHTCWKTMIPQGEMISAIMDMRIDKMWMSFTNIHLLRTAYNDHTIDREWQSYGTNDGNLFILIDHVMWLLNSEIKVFLIFSVCLLIEQPRSYKDENLIIICVSIVPPASQEIPIFRTIVQCKMCV